MPRIFRIFFCLVFTVSAAGCFIRPRNMPVAPAPLSTLTPNFLTPTPPWVITATFTPEAGGATPNVTTAPGMTATEGPSGPTLAPTAVTSTVNYVLVKDDVRLRRGPGTSYDALGLVHAGMTLVVTGKSVDDGWWQVNCDQGPNNICWVSADPELTEPVQTPP